MRIAATCCLLSLVWGVGGAIGAADEPWPRHTIDDSSRGADGVRLGDVDGDGKQDLVCGWEEGGVIRVYLQPADVRRPWPQVTVGKVKSPEDAVFVDLDQDGRLDVVSSTEGRTRTLYVHWARWNADDRSQILDPSRWRTEAIPCAQGNQAWMFALPMELDGRPGPELIVGSKGRGASISLLRCAGDDRRKLSNYSLQRLVKAGWIMSLESADIDGDGDQDVLATDRKGASPAVLWLENPGTAAAGDKGSWKSHRIAGEGLEVMFLAYGDLLGDPRSEIVTATRNQKLLISSAPSDPRQPWLTRSIPNPFATPHGKAVAIADLDGDGRSDLIHTVNNGGNRKYPGAAWMRSSDQWRTATAHNISGKEGVKFDLIQVMDVDGDGDLDWLSCEERDNLGLFWYENPLGADK